MINSSAGLEIAQNICKLPFKISKGGAFRTLHFERDVDIAQRCEVEFGIIRDEFRIIWDNPKKDQDSSPSDFKMAT